MGLTIFIGGLHLVSVFLPLWFGDCPTTTPVLTHLRWMGVYVSRLYLLVVTQVSWIVWSRLKRRRIRQNAILNNPVSHDDSSIFSEWSIIEKESPMPSSNPALSPAAYDGSRIIEGREPLRDAL
ncbi:hypothetical protein BKA62DRAFT_727752, partial [Auriculariales sp. MPI-PUGE-AT-0066]